MGNALQKPKETEEEEGRQDAASNFTCEICIEPMVASTKFRNGSSCIHPFCLDCVAKYIEVKLEDGSTGHIECPAVNCKQELDPLSCRPIIMKPIFEKWCDRLCDCTVVGSKSCYCPYEDCSALILNECPRYKPTKIQCPNCKKSLCFLCKIPWHAGFRCDESRILKDRNDILAGKLIEEKRWTRCSNCGYSVELLSGCRQVKCKCGFTFCHECGRGVHPGPCPQERFCEKCGEIHWGLPCNDKLLWLCLLCYAIVGQGLMLLLGFVSNKYDK